MKRKAGEGRITPIVLYEALLHISRLEGEEIIPSFSYTIGFVYGDLFKIASKHRVSDRDLLDELTRIGVLEKIPYDSFVKCPRCKSFRLLSRFKCPRCGSKNLRRITMVSHVPCGYTGVLEDMATAEGYVCKKCGKPLRREGDDYIVIGRIFTCEDCGARFDNPLSAFKCSNCQLEFDYKNADYVTVYKYRIRRDVLKEKARQVLVELVKAAARAEGLRVEAPSRAPGRSGYTHEVDVAVSDGKKHVLIDVVHESTSAMSEALAALGKGSDIIASMHLLLAPTKVVEMEPLKSSESIKTLGYETAEEAYNKLREMLRKHFRKR